MTIKGIRINIGKTSSGDIKKHLLRCNDSFIPPLASRVDIDGYSAKLSEKAVTFGAFYGEELVGLVAAYFSKTQEGEAFISNVSVTEEFTGTGLAHELLDLCINYACEHQFSEIVLEVSELNLRAVKFYRNHGFRTLSKNGDQLKMEYSKMHS
jgi:ribosomal protein S18 acetylase RimI-like enzyme